MLSAAHERRGSPSLALAIQQQALDAVATDDGPRWVPDFALCRLHQTHSTTQRALGHATQAKQAAARAVTIAQRGRMRDELYKSYGCLGLAELSERAVTRLPGARGTEIERTQLQNALGALIQLCERIT